MQRKNRFLWMLMILFMLAAGCGSEGEVEVSEVWARPGLKEGNSAVFFIVNNFTDIDDKILSAGSDIAAAVELHESVMVDDVMRMQKQESVLLPAGNEVVFEPGGLHVMLIGLNGDLQVGDAFTVTLVLEGAGEITIEAVVREP